MKPNSTVATILGLALLAAFVYALYYAARFGLGLFGGVDPDVTAVTAAAAITLLVAATIIGNGLHAVARGEDLRQQRGIRAAVYEQALHLRSAGAGAFRSEDEQGVERGILLHGSPAVVSAYLRLRRVDSPGGGAPDELAQLVRAMRRDLGHRGSDVATTELAELLRPATRERPAPPRTFGGEIRLSSARRPEAEADEV